MLLSHPALDIFLRHLEQMHRKQGFRVDMTESEIRDWIIQVLVIILSGRHLAQMHRNGPSKAEQMYTNLKQVLDQPHIHLIMEKFVLTLRHQPFIFDPKKEPEMRHLDHLIIKLAEILVARNRRCTFGLMMSLVIPILVLGLMHQEMRIRFMDHRTQ
jgi:hypothetical protein